ncbi:MAG: tetratricopeptide repeat protein, partial [Chloroflexi bacterium]
DDYRVVLALDTAEVLLYEPDPVQRSLALAPQGIEARGWLIERFLPSLRNTVVLIAGRPGPARLREDLQAALGERLIERTLGPLEEPDSLDYFQTVAQAARKRGSEMVAARLEAIPEETRRVIHLYTEGRPILLALTIDYLAVADRLLPEVQTPLEEARAMSPDQLRQVRERLEREIVRAIQETGRRADEAIRALAWTRRGMEARLLARLLETTEEEAEQLLKELRPLSFVKIRPADNRVFLQDEMYALLERHVLRRLPEARARWVYDTILQFYDEEIEKARRDLQRLQAAPEAPLDQLERTRVRLQNAIAERVHYALRRDPERGFEAYYRAAEETFIAYHRALDMQLRAELLEFLEQAPEEAKAIIADRATWDLGVRWIKRSIVFARYDEAVQIAIRLRAEAADLMERLGPVAEAELSVWEGWARAYAGQDLDLAEDRLRAAIEALVRLQPRTPFEREQRRALLARAHNNLGYLLRVRGRFREAAEQYRRALPLWRALGPDFESEAANTLNNLAWALAEAGKFGQALRFCRDALELRRRLGPRYPIALSLNTLAMIQIRNDQPDQAADLARQALTIFYDLENWRGIGLASRALAEALRRKAWIPYRYTPEAQEELLKEARRLADEAVAVFTHRVEERSRLIESLIELGCIYRDWIRVHPLASTLEATDREEMALRAERTLQRAADEAGETFPHLRVDAQVNLAWLYFYAGRPEKAEEAVETVFQSLPADFFITPE